MSAVVWELFGLNDIKDCYNDPKLSKCAVAAMMVLPVGKLKAVSELKDVGKIAKAADTTGRLSDEAIDAAWMGWNTSANLGHVIDPAKHGLADLVTKTGGRENALRAILDSLKDADDMPKGGLYEVTRIIEGEKVTIRGAMVKGIPRLGTAFNPDKYVKP